jgi:DNA-binding transcriptional regulator GbsR (MarR family)
METDMSAFMDIPEVRSFIRHWGEMGTEWGVNRSVAQVHALLFLSDRPLHAEEICHKLGLARSNVSNGLKELQAYALVKRVHIEADRRDHFEAYTDPWDMLMKIAAERKRREFDPTIQLLGELRESLQGRDHVPDHVEQRIGDMHQFLDSASHWYEDVRGLPRATLVTLMKLGGKVARLLPGTRKS